MSMKPEAKQLLSRTIRSLHDDLIPQLTRETQRLYQLRIAAADARLDEAHNRKRARLEAYLAEEVRASKGKRARSADDFLRDIVKQAASTLVNRLIVLRVLEAGQRRRNLVLSGGQESPDYITFAQLAPPLTDVSDDESRGYEFLLGLVFEELSVDLPGLFGPAGIADLIVAPWPILRKVIEALNQPGLESCWTDDMTLGWVYQYWNDPDREALDAKLNARGKLEGHEIASKTQMFTERYMVDWLLQNSLGPLWLAICKKNSWTPAVVANGTLANLDARRAEFRGKRERGEVPLTALMELDSDAERYWAYYVPQTLPEDAPDHAPTSIRDVKILDPAVGSGHFLVIAFELLVALYDEEAGHRGEKGQEQWSEKKVAECILENNLHGIDLDPRAIQIAAAALWLKARETCPKARPHHLNLVASDLRLASLPTNDPALKELREAIKRDTGIPHELTDEIIEGLKGADHLGSLLRVAHTVEDAIKAYEDPAARKDEPDGQGSFLPTFAEEAKRNILERLETFLKAHTSGDDLGLRLRGEQLATGVRFLRMTREGTYDLVVGNPPYQDTSDISDAGNLERQFPDAGTDLFSMFITRAVELVVQGGWAAMVTKQDWLYLHRFRHLRRHLECRHIFAIANLGAGAFAQIGGEVVQAVAFSLRASSESAADLAMTVVDASEGLDSREKAAMLHVAEPSRRYPAAYRNIDGAPLVLAWDNAFVSWYASTSKLGQECAVKQGLATGDNIRFLRSPNEIHPMRRQFVKFEDYGASEVDVIMAPWVPYIKGAKGLEWFEPGTHAIRWAPAGLQIKLLERDGKLASRPQNEEFYLKPGVAFASTGSRFSARLHRFRSIFDVKGQSVFPRMRESVCCVMNSDRGRQILQQLNPSISFQVGDAKRLPLFAIHGVERVFQTLAREFSQHESHREPSVEFRRPGPSPWRHAQEWAQAAVDRPEGAPLPVYTAEHDPEPVTDHLSFALGVALGRFGADGQGVLDPGKDDLAHTLPHGILFIDTSLHPSDDRDSLGHPTARRIVSTWEEHGSAIASGSDLRGYLAHKFFELHRKMYDNRPIHWPVSSEKRTFVAWITIHRWDDSTLRALLAYHLNPALARIDGELPDLRAARDGKDKKAARVAEKRLAVVLKARDELVAFIAAVEQCAEEGPPPSDNKGRKREDVRYAPDLDDGVMINSAALWPLLAPQWKDPKKWWSELAAGEGKKDYDWSHLAMRYWPRHVDEKCRNDPSLAVAHGCFWRYHPPRAWAWELRLQDEIAADFRIEEAPYRGEGGHEAHRTVFLADHPIHALAIVEKEVLRRTRKHDRLQPNIRLLEPGLWTSVPQECWFLELRILGRYRKILRKKRKAGLPVEDLPGFRLIAPDEPGDRLTIPTAFPKEFARRRQLLETELDLEIEDEGDDEDEDEVTSADDDADDAHDEEDEA